MPDGRPVRADAVEEIRTLNLRMLRHGVFLVFVLDGDSLPAKFEEQQRRRNVRKEVRAKLDDALQEYHLNQRVFSSQSHIS